MTSNQTQIKQKETEKTMILETDALMISPTGDSYPTMRNSHFLKPVLNPLCQPPPRPPLHSLTSNSNTKLSDLTQRITFRGRHKLSRDWMAWTDDMQKTHQSIWKKAGIFNAIKASTYKIRRDDELVVALAERWCPETNTFVFPWGEATVTLEDVMVLGGFSVLGVSVTDNSPKDGKFMEIEAKLKAAGTVIFRECSNVITQNRFMEYFKGMGGETEHVAFLVVWLSKFVFSSSYKLQHWSISKVAPIAYNIARGTKVALAPTVLASIYRDLSVLKKKIVSLNMSECGDDESKLLIWAPIHLVQLWAWERFRKLAPRPKTLHLGEPRLARWKDVGILTGIGNHRLEIESSGDAFLWRPYAVSLKNWDLPKFYSDKETRVVLNCEVEEDLLSFARCLSPWELVNFDCLEQYLPHRVGMQFGYDQDIPELAWSNYDDKQFDGLKLYLPPRLFEGDVTVQYRDWWNSTVAVSDEKFSNFKRKARTRRARKMRKVSKIVLVGFGGDDDKAPPCSRVSCNGVRTSKIGGPESLLAVGDEIKQDNAMEPVIELEKGSDLYEHVVKDKEKKYVIDCTVITGNNCSEVFRLEKNSVTEIHVISENEHGNARGSFLGQISEVEARIRRLQRLVALIKTSKTGCLDQDLE